MSELDIVRTGSAQKALSLGVPKTKFEGALNTTLWETVTNILGGK